MAHGQTSAAALTRLRDDEALFRETMRRFAETEVRPLVAAMDRQGEIPRALVDALFALGVMGIEIPTAHGGGGGSFFMAILAIEELARVDPAVAVCADVQNALVNKAMLRWATPAQQAAHLRALATETVGAYALSEADSGSDAFAMATRARRDGDGYVLNGCKAWTTNGAEAGLYVVFANADPERRQRGITAFLVERGRAGVGVGPRTEKLGIRASSTCELVLEDCRVPRANVLGQVGHGYKVAIETLNEGRIGIGAQMVGVARGAYEAARNYANERKQFGRVISHFQIGRAHV